MGCGVRLLGCIASLDIYYLSPLLSYLMHHSTLNLYKSPQDYIKLPLTRQQNKEHLGKILFHSEPNLHEPSNTITCSNRWELEGSDGA